MTNNQKKVVVAMSGGVDSSVSAALLNQQGYEVTGVFMRLWKDKKQKFPSEAERRAKTIADYLKIKFKPIDFQKEFQQKVVKRFLAEYQQGVTPNPCVFCNEEIKFGLLLKAAQKLGADYLATGHYVRVKQTAAGYKLLKSQDSQKDQTYFLWRLSQKQLSRVLFPVGDQTKERTRELAEEFKLPSFSGSAARLVKESQEICFITQGINEFLARFLKPKRGVVVDLSGKKLGEHQGLVFYTFGQRKGIGLSGGPYFVKAKDFKNNQLIVTKNENDLYQKELEVKDTNWLSGVEPEKPFTASVKIRYRQEPVLAKMIPGKKCRILFSKPQRAVTPGQSAVFYKGEELLGGGIIKIVQT